MLYNEGCNTIIFKFGSDSEGNRWGMIDVVCFGESKRIERYNDVSYTWGPSQM